MLPPQDFSHHIYNVMDGSNGLADVARSGVIPGIPVPADTTEAPVMGPRESDFPGAMPHKNGPHHTFGAAL